MMIGHSMNISCIVTLIKSASEKGVKSAFVPFMLVYLDNN